MNIYFTSGIRSAGKVGPITQALMEEEFRQWKLAYAKRHGHPFPDFALYGSNDAESVAWLRR